VDDIMNRFWTRLRMASAVLALTALAAACGGGGGGSSTSGQGSLRVALTDAPACGYDEVNVTVVRVDVHRSSEAMDTDSGWQSLVLDPPRRVDLLTLTNGVLEELGTTTLPVGTYTQLRLVLAGNSPQDPMANSLVPTGQDEVPLQTPSAQQTGLKIPVNLVVEEGEMADVVLDFDACKSVVRAGNSGRYLLKPVLTAIPRVDNGALSVLGHLTALPPSGAAVSLQQDGLVARATVTDAQGRFLLSPVPAGNYDLVIAAEGRVTLVMTGVPVSDVGRTTINPSSTPIALTNSDMRSVSGVVSTSGSAEVPDAMVRALQTVNGQTIEWTARPVDADTGGYLFSLPVAAPAFTAYDVAATSYSFTPDAGAAARYTVQARVPGQDNQEAEVDLSSADQTADFVFAP
jgi:hypothetical protein